MTYTPTTEQVREDYATRMAPHLDDTRRKQFQRWLEGHDREIKAQALEEAADHITEIDGRKDDKAAQWLRTRAQQLKEKP